MTFEEWVKKYEGKTWGYPAGSYVGECLSLTKWHIKEVYGINPPPSGVNSAYGYWTNFPDPLGTVFKKVPNTPDLIPQRGWIVIWNNKVGGGYGHIASILSANINNFISLDQNWGSKSAQRVTHNYSNVYGFLAPKQGSSEPESTNMMQIEESKFQELVTKSTKYDEFVKAGYQSAEQVNVKTAELSSKIGDYAKKITALEAEVERLSESQNQVVEVKNEYVEAQKILREMLPNGAKKIVGSDGNEKIEISFKLRNEK